MFPLTSSSSALFSETNGPIRSLLDQILPELQKAEIASAAMGSVLKVIMLNCILRMISFTSVPWIV